MHLHNRQILGINRDLSGPGSFSGAAMPSPGGIIVGLAGGLAGTIAMHVFGIGIFLVMGQPISISFSIIGDAAASFFARLGVELAGGAPLGMVVFYLLGLALGVTFVVLVLRIEAFRLDSIRKGVGLGVLYVEVLSLPLLATATFVLNMMAASAALWFGISIVMHLVYGAVMGAVASYGLRSGLKPRTDDFVAGRPHLCGTRDRHARRPAAVHRGVV